MNIVMATQHTDFRIANVVAFKLSDGGVGWALKADGTEVRFSNIQSIRPTNYKYATC